MAHICVRRAPEISGFAAEIGGFAAGINGEVAK